MSDNTEVKDQEEVQGSTEKQIGAEEVTKTTTKEEGASVSASGEGEGGTKTEEVSCTMIVIAKSKIFI